MDTYLTKNSRKNINIISMLSVPFKKAPILSIKLMLLTVLDGLILTLQVVVTTNLVNHVIDAVKNGYQYTNIGEIVLFCFIFAYQWLSQDLQKLFLIKVNINVSEYLDVLAIQKISKLKFYHVENNESWNLISRVKPKLSTNVNNFFVDMLGFISLMIKIVGVVVLVFTHVWWSAVLIVVLLLPLSLLINRSAHANYEAEKKISESNRYAEYFKGILSTKELVDERELFGFGKYLNDKYKKNYDLAQKIRFKTRRIWYVKMKTGSLVSSIFLALIIFSFLNPVIKGKITIGFFMSITQAVFSLIQKLSWDLTGYIDRFATMNEFCKDADKFFKLDEEKNFKTSDEKILNNREKLFKNEEKLFQYQELKTDNSSKAKHLQIHSVEFDNVSFHYPHNEHYVLKNVSFSMNDKKCYAFVGANGSGKTTIIKLLAGLYDNYTGSIKINRQDIRELSFDELHALVYPLFQDYAQYQISLKDNILLGDIKHMDDNNIKMNLALDKMNKAIDMVDMHEFIESLPNGVETELGKVDKNGVGLSGGQWQRVAIMRALVNPAPLKILDEPTAALDPINESNLYKEFSNMMQDNMTILISHRLGATKLADEIFVIDKGLIKERGTHDELIKINGLYADMFNSQKGWYA